jgi:hypothetical protein
METAAEQRFESFATTRIDCQRIGYGRHKSNGLETLVVIPNLLEHLAQDGNATEQLRALIGATSILLTTDVFRVTSDTRAGVYGQ